jgi:branched-chain amino acid transport system permease protein
LLGLSYLFIYRATRVLSFAVGGVAGMAGVAAATWTALPSTIAALTAVGLGAISAIVIDIVVVRPVQAREVGHFGTVLALAACLFVLIQLTGAAFTQITVIGQPLVDGAIDIPGATITWQSIVAVGAAVLGTAMTVLWLQWGKRGRLLAALGDNPRAATMLCLPIGTVRMLAVTLAGITAGAVGVLNVGRAPMTFQSGFDMSLVGFLAIVIGGTASAWGPLCGGLLLGLLESVGARVIGAQWREYLFLAVVLLVFRLRPLGIFSTSVRHWD